MNENRKQIKIDIYDIIMIIFLIFAIIFNLFLLKESKTNIFKLINNNIDINHVNNNIEILEDIIYNVEKQVNNIDFLNEEDRSEVEDNINTSLDKIELFKQKSSTILEEKNRIKKPSEIDKVGFIPLIDEIVLEINRFNKKSIDLKTGNYIDYDIVNNFDSIYNDFQNKSIGFKNKVFGYSLLEEYSNFRISVDELPWSYTRRILSNHTTDLKIRNLAVNEANFLYKLNITFMIISFFIFIHNLIRKKENKVFEACKNTTIILFIGSLLILGLSYYTVLMKNLMLYI